MSDHSSNTDVWAVLAIILTILVTVFLFINTVLSPQPRRDEVEVNPRIEAPRVEVNPPSAPPVVVPSPTS